ncbi:fatty acid cis/trans isomerase [Ruegeria sp.]|uniref:fatty acid cis/trans isomerase n=1 Tax=Ruegeria sp. TaxID=1879320 RepID=UPI003B00CD10
MPETAWVIDYPVFERIYYNLVAGYDVFGRVEHQLATRIYMDELRMESEDNFLTFMPRNLRPGMHESWYRGVLARLHTFWHTRRIDDTMPTGITFETDAPKQEFFLRLLARGNGLWSLSDPINRCDDGDCTQVALTALASQTGPWVKFLPDLSLLVVETSDDTTEVFTLIHDKAHTNIAFLFDESARREPEKDVLTILPEMIGSYPNFFFKLPEAQLPDFIQAVKAVATQEDWMQLIADFGVRRTSEDFWVISDKIHARFLKDKPIQAGILDLNRYKDPKPGEDPT